MFYLLFSDYKVNASLLFYIFEKSLDEFTIRIEAKMLLGLYFSPKRIVADSPTPCRGTPYLESVHKLQLSGFKYIR
jgi:hypothetical protein